MLYIMVYKILSIMSYIFCFMSYWLIQIYSRMLSSYRGSRCSYLGSSSILQLNDGWWCEIISLYYSGYVYFHSSPLLSSLTLLLLSLPPSFLSIIFSNRTQAGYWLSVLTALSEVFLMWSFEKYFKLKKIFMWSLIWCINILEFLVVSHLCMARIKPIWPDFNSFWDCKIPSSSKD